MEKARRIEHEYRVRFDEAGADGCLRPSSLLRYAQDMAWRHSEEAGFDRGWYERRSMHWLVRNVKVSIEGSITYGDELAVSTEVIGWRHVWARRHSEVRRTGSSASTSANELMATVETDWVLLTSAGRPARVPAEIGRYFAPAAPFTRDRIVLPEPGGEVSTLSTRVRPLDVDPMRHMNNAAYLDMVEDGLSRMPDGARPEGADCYRIGYVLPALPGTPIEVSCWAADESPGGEPHQRRQRCRAREGAGRSLEPFAARLAVPGDPVPGPLPTPTAFIGSRPDGLSLSKRSLVDVWEYRGMGASDAGAAGTGEPIRFRAARADDAPAMVEVFIAAIPPPIAAVHILGAPMASHFVRDSITAASRGGDSMYWVAERDGHGVVGFVQLRQSLKVAVIDNLHVLPTYQRQGIGTAMLRTALDRVATERVGIDVFRDSEAAMGRLAQGSSKRCSCATGASWRLNVVSPGTSTFTICPRRRPCSAPTPSPRCTSRPLTVCTQSAGSGNAGFACCRVASSRTTTCELRSGSWTPAVRSSPCSAVMTTAAPGARPHQLPPGGKRGRSRSAVAP